MKKLLLILGGIVLSMNLNAQFLFNNHNVIIWNDLNEEQLGICRDVHKFLKLLTIK